MHKVLKFLSILFVTLLLTALVAVICLVTFVSPNRFKPLLTEKVMQYTGRKLVIDGDLSWKFFPSLGIQIGHSTLGNPDGFSQATFAEMANMTVDVKLLPLLRRRIESSGIAFSGLTLHLLKNAKGNVNWNFPHAISPQVTDAGRSSGEHKTPVELSVSSVDLKHAVIDYTDEQTKQYYTIKNVEFQAKDINLFQAFPITSSFDFTANNPLISGHARLNSKVDIQMPANVYTLRDLDFSANILQADSKNITLNISGDVIADLTQQTVAISQLKAKIANVEMTGKFNVSSLNRNPVTRAHLQLSPFDLKETFKSIGYDVPNLQVAKSVKGDVELSKDANGLTLQGNLKVDTLQVAKLNLTNIVVNTHYQKGILDLAPLTAKLYQGNLLAQMLVNLNSPVPQITLHGKITNVAAQPLLEDLGGKEQQVKIAGVANFEMQMTTAGTQAQAILQNLNGVSQFTFNNGNLIGVDLGYIVDSAYALIKRQPLTATNTHQTSFGTLSGTAVVRSGVISNNDLFADTPRFAIRGVGTIDLVQQKIDYALQTLIKQRADQKDNAMNLYGITLPIIVSGNINSPVVRLDSAALAKAVTVQQLQKGTDQAKDTLRDQLQKRLPGKAGDVLNNLLGK